MSESREPSEFWVRDQVASFGPTVHDLPKFVVFDHPNIEGVKFKVVEVLPESSQSGVESVDYWKEQERLQSKRGDIWEHETLKLRKENEALRSRCEKALGMLPPEGMTFGPNDAENLHTVLSGGFDGSKP